MISRLFRWLFPKPPEMDHPVFGRLMYFKFKDPEKNYWEPQATIRMNGLELEISIDADEAGPSDAQVAFAERITGDRDALFERCRSLLEPEYQPWKKAPIPEDVWREFNWVGLSVPRGAEEKAPWDVSFTVNSDPALFFTVYFKNSRADVVGVSR